MTIQPNRPDLSRLDANAPAPPDAPARPSADEARPEPSRVVETDRVELSEAARARSAETEVPAEPKDPTVEKASQTLRDWPSLDPERKAQIMARLEEGFYSRPDTLQEVAERLYDDLVGMPLRDAS